jgi:hypothetical protein
MNAIRSILLITALCLSQSARSEDCAPREFAQYRQDAKAGPGRISLAFGYCRMRQQRDAELNGTALARRCESEMTKTLDALSAVKAAPAVEFARSGCAGDYPARDTIR